MITTEPPKVNPIEVLEPRRWNFALAARASLYTLLVLTVALGTGAYSVRTHGIFSCQASGYSANRYLSYCNATGYGDYDHGAIWLGLEPAASSAAANAQVLFLGSSHTVFGFSSRATDDWFSSNSRSYFLLGFTHYENYTFEVPLLHRLHARAKVYVINIDSFFEQSETGPGKTVMQDESAKTDYMEKRRLQAIQVVCTAFKALCGHSEAIFRSRSTGAWSVTGNRFTSQPVSYDDGIDPKKLASYTALGKEFLPGLTEDQACTILTIVPTVKTEIGTAEAVASALGRSLVAPRLAGLMTFDGSHLDPESAQRWSAAFLQQAGPQIQQCLSKQLESRAAIGSGRPQSMRQFHKVTINH